MVIKLAFRINDGAEEIEAKECGLLPIMVRVRIECWAHARAHSTNVYDGNVLQSNRCNLKNLSAADLVAHKEEAEEFGGYFIVNGNERLIRYLILPRRNHVISLIRNSFANRGPSYTPYAVNIRCVRPDQSGVTNSLHYLSNGSAMLRFSWRKQEYLIPFMLVIKALVSTSDKEVFEGVMMGDYENTFLSDRVELLLRSFKTFKLHTGEQCLDYLGDKFRVVAGMPEDWNNLRMGSWLLNKVILVHLDHPRDKYRLLLLVISSFYPGNWLHSLRISQGSCSENSFRSSLVNAAEIILILHNTKRYCFLDHCTE
jgi:DNA-directed RNA polymerase I subunit RPA2